MNERTVFLEALEQPTSDRREAFLQQACGADAELRRKVDDLLRAHSDAGSFIEHSPAGVAATKLTGAAEDTDDRTARSPTSNPASGATDVDLSFLARSNVPDQLGKLGLYEVLEVIGKGAFGIVLRALDPKLNRIVAIKVLAPELTVNAMSVQRFLKEAQAAAAVSHDHVVTIHAVDDAGTFPFIVMECIIGQSLQNKIDKQGALQVTEILRIGSQIAEGLAAAHKQGLVHRDIKPSNILLENGIQRVKITDFGLARAVDDLAATQTFQVAGTPQYMSPEQAHGETIDQRSDLFSLGSVLYTMSTGRPAFRAESIMGILKRVCDDTPRPIREVNPDIPDWLAAMISRLMQKKRDDRYQSASEVAEVISNHLFEVQQTGLSAQGLQKRTVPEPNSQERLKRQFSPISVFATMAGLTMAVMLGLAFLLVVGLILPVVYWFMQSHPVDQPGASSRHSSEIVAYRSTGTTAVPWTHESTAPWIDLLTSDVLKKLSATVQGTRWQDGKLVLSSDSRGTYCQVWVDNVRLHNARMRLKAQVHRLSPFGSVEMGWDHLSGSPRRLDAILVKPSDDRDLFATWQYNEAFTVNRLHERAIHPDWKNPITLASEIRNGQIVAQFANEVIHVTNGLSPDRPVVPLIGVENASWTILEWQVQDLDAAPEQPAEPGAASTE